MTGLLLTFHCVRLFLRTQTEVRSLVMRNTQQTIMTISKSSLMNQLVGWGYSQERHEGSLPESWMTQRYLHPGKSHLNVSDSLRKLYPWNSPYDCKHLDRSENPLSSPDLTVYMTLVKVIWSFLGTSETCELLTSWSLMSLFLVLCPDRRSQRNHFRVQTCMQKQRVFIQAQPGTFHISNTAVWELWGQLQ